MDLVKIDFAPDQPKTIFVTWTLHNFCNYRCSYCPPGCHAGSKRPYDANDVIRFSRDVVENAKRKGYTNFTFAFSGGEPTLFPGFEEVAKTLYAEGVDITFTSNGSRKLDFWQKMVPHFNHCVWSYHPEMVKQEEFFEKAKFVTQHCWLNVDFMMTKEHFDQNLELGAMLAELPNIRVDYLPIQIEFGGNSQGVIDYSKEQLEFLQSIPYTFKEPTGVVAEKMKKFKVFGRGRKIVERVISGNRVQEILNYKSLIAKDEIKFSGWECFAGIESLIVNFDGTLLRAYCNQGGVIGDIWNTLSLPTEPVICAVERCKCSVDIEVTKRKRSDDERI